MRQENVPVGQHLPLDLYHGMRSIWHIVLWHSAVPRITNSKGDPMRWHTHSMLTASKVQSEWNDRMIIEQEFPTAKDNCEKFINLPACAAACDTKACSAAPAETAGAWAGAQETSHRPRFARQAGRRQPRASSVLTVRETGSRG